MEPAQDQTAGRPRIYLAGPMIFYPDPETTFDQMKAICRRHGLLGVSPLDNQNGLEGKSTDRALLEQVITADMELMDTLDGGLFCLDGFRRSPEMDPGTAFEVGYMRALKKPLAGWTSDPRDYPAKVRDYFRDTFGLALVATEPGSKGATSGTTRDPDGILVHSENCLQNAMIDVGIATAGGQVFGHASWGAAFSQAATALAAQIVASSSQAGGGGRP
jgi:nucleoside 2-deoxyribosyltransferase